MSLGVDDTGAGVEDDHSAGDAHLVRALTPDWTVVSVAKTTRGPSHAGSYRPATPLRQGTTLGGTPLDPPVLVPPLFVSSFEWFPDEVTLGPIEGRAREP